MWFSSLETPTLVQLKWFKPVLVLARTVCNTWPNLVSESVSYICSRSFCELLMTWWWSKQPRARYLYAVIKAVFKEIANKMINFLINKVADVYRRVPMYIFYPTLYGHHNHTPRNYGAHEGSLQRIDPTLDLLHRFPLRLGRPRQCGYWEALPNTSTHDRSDTYIHTLQARPMYALYNIPGTIRCVLQVSRVAPPFCEIQNFECSLLAGIEPWPPAQESSTLPTTPLNSINCL